MKKRCYFCVYAAAAMMLTLPAFAASMTATNSLLAQHEKTEIVEVKRCPRLVKMNSFQLETLCLKAANHVS